MPVICIGQVQYVNKIVEVPQIQQQQIEQIVEQVVHVPQIVEQKRVQHRHVEQFVDVPVTQASPPQEQVVEIPVPMQEEEIVHVPKIITQTRVQHQQAVDLGLKIASDGLLKMDFGAVELGKSGPAGGTGGGGARAHDARGGRLARCGSREV